MEGTTDKLVYVINSYIMLSDKYD